MPQTDRTKCLLVDDVEENLIALEAQAAGGLTIVQDPASASMPTMPQAALAALAVDHILPPEGIARLLADLHQRQQL